MWPLRTICCILWVSKITLDQNTKIRSWDLILLICLDSQGSTKFTIARYCHEKKDDIFPKTKKDLVVLTRQCLLRGPRFKELIWEKRGSLTLAFTDTASLRIGLTFEYDRKNFWGSASDSQSQAAAFFSYQFFKSANIGLNTAASIQPNPFWFWENIYI